MRSSSSVVSARAERVGEVLVVRLAGVFTPQTPALVMPVVRELLLEEDARAVVLNVQMAVLTLTDVGWQALKDATEAAAWPQPVAVVAAPMYEAEIRAYCRDMANRGLVRGPFIGEPAAVVWASKCREHWPHRPRVEALCAPPPPPGWQSPRPERIGRIRAL